MTGASELSDLLFEARGQKPIKAFVEGLAQSGAYWLASAADEIVTVDTGLLGSIGVITSILDFRKMDERLGIKEHGFVSTQSPNKWPDPATKPGATQILAILDDLASVFVAKVARHRGLSPDEVIRRFGGGVSMVGQAAVAAGLADRVGTLRSVVASLKPPPPKPLSYLPPAGVASTTRENESMNLSSLTIDQLRAARPDLVESLVLYGFALGKRHSGRVRGAREQESRARNAAAREGERLVGLARDCGVVR